jgi:hypothetical protein
MGLGLVVRNAGLGTLHPSKFVLCIGDHVQGMIGMQMN